MALTDHIVSLWQDQKAIGFVCSGVQIETRHILTAGHACAKLDPEGRVFVGQLRGKHGAQPATLCVRHKTLDAAIFQLVEPIECPRLRLPETIEAYRGMRPWFHAIDPDSHDVVSLDHGTIGDYDAALAEFIVSPHTAQGYSGGLLALGEEPVGLLTCRIAGEPIARAVALAELRPWIGWAIDSPRGPDATPPPGYETLLGLLGPRALQWLADPGTAELRRLAGFPQRAARLPGRPLQERFETLVVDLHKATEHCLGVWRTRGQPIPVDFKANCYALLGELLKGAVDRAGRTTAELAELAAATPERMYIACQFVGTAATVYCSIRDLPLRLTEPKGALDIGGGSVIDLTDLAQGVGTDVERDVFVAVWGAYTGKEPPVDFRNEQARLPYLTRLKKMIAQGVTSYGYDPRFLVAKGPREWLRGPGLASASDQLRIGLVIHSPGSDYACLAVDEDTLLYHACEYLKLLGTL